MNNQATPLAEPAVILVDENDNPIGTAPKLQAHIDGVLHRAFSVFVFNRDGQLLLQRRAMHKYHSGGLWTNSCCSHPSPGESTHDACQRRLQEEMGFVCEVTPAFSFVYRTDFENGLIEHEYDHVFVGEYNGAVAPDQEEVHEYRWVSFTGIDQMLVNDPEQFTYWFKHVYDRVKNYRAQAGGHEV